jgi:hypothetical protein
VIDTSPVITVSVAEAEGYVTHVRLGWSPEADLEQTIQSVSDQQNLSNWNTVPGRQFQLDEEGWTQTENGGSLQFETAVETSFRRAGGLY